MPVFCARCAFRSSVTGSGLLATGFSALADGMYAGFRTTVMGCRTAISGCAAYRTVDRFERAALLVMLVLAVTGRWDWRYCCFGAFAFVLVLLPGLPRGCDVCGDNNAVGGAATGAYCGSMLDDAVAGFLVVPDLPTSSAALFHSARHPPGKYAGCGGARAGVESNVLGIGGTGDWGIRSTLGKMGGIFSWGGLAMRSALSLTPWFFS